MSHSRELLELAQHLAKKESKKPKQASLKRSISTAYYALFHFTIEHSYRILFKNNPEMKKIVYRKFEHKTFLETARRHKSSNNLDIAGLSSIIILLQSERHHADYDVFKPTYRATVYQLINEVVTYKSIWARCVASNSPEFTAFVTELLFGKPR